MAGKLGSIVQGRSADKDPARLFVSKPFKPRDRAQKFEAQEFLWFKTRDPGEAHFMPMIGVLVNPETFSERVGVTYAKDNVLGLSHQVIQYTHTESRTIPLEIYISLHILIQKNLGHKVEDLLAWRDSFRALTVPVALGLAPPTVKVIWPNAKLKFEGVVESMDTTYESFTDEGHPMSYTLSLDFLATPSTFMTSGSFTRVNIKNKKR